MAPCSVFCRRINTGKESDPILCSDTVLFCVTNCIYASPQKPKKSCWKCNLEAFSALRYFLCRAVFYLWVAIGKSRKIQKSTPTHTPKIKCWKLLSHILTKTKNVAWSSDRQISKAEKLEENIPSVIILNTLDRVQLINQRTPCGLLVK